MFINNYYIKEAELSENQIENLGLDYMQDYICVEREDVEKGRETQIKEYFTVDEFQEILELGMYYLKARKEQDEEFDEAELEKMAWEDERAASYGFRSKQEMDEYIKEYNDSITEER